MKQVEFAVNGLTFLAREHGSGTPAILLHGFPETSRMWEPLMRRLADEDVHCLAPDQRGYSPGARPDGPENYTYGHFASDIGGFMDAMGWERVHLIGHDWGAAAGWAAVGLFPERVVSWTPMSVPHLTAFGKAIRENAEQQQKSQYINFFRQAGAAENTFIADDYAALRGLGEEGHGDRPGIGGGGRLAYEGTVHATRDRLRSLARPGGVRQDRRPYRPAPQQALVGDCRHGSRIVR